MTDVTTMCKIEGCERSKKSRGWCKMHYQHWYRYGDPLISRSPKKPLPEACAVEGCGSKPINVRGWCGMHYQRWRTYGDPIVTKRPNLVIGTVEERFWSKVDKTGECWEWTAASADGYGRFGIEGKSVQRAHRVAYELLVGPIPESLVLDHLCRNTGCVNPAHLDPVTQNENVRRGQHPSGDQHYLGGKTHCLRGHEFTPGNTYKPPGKNQRHCRACKNERDRERRRRQRSGT